MSKHLGDGAYLASHAIRSIKWALVLAGAFMLVGSLSLAALFMWVAVKFGGVAQ